MSTTERARHWRHPGLPGVDLLRARYVGKTFPLHTHEAFVVAAVSQGVEAFRHRGTVEQVGPGALALINPDTPHTGHAAVPEGWTYCVLYPGAEVVGAVAAETTTVRGTAGFGVAVADDPYAARLVAAVHRGVEQNDPLTADTLLRLALAHLLARYGGAPPRPPRSAGLRTARRAREVLEERMAEPPSLRELADELATGPFALLRSFRAAYGMPPHTWLTDARIRRARRLLDTGMAPARVAAEVGFADQPHLTRHFTRIVGVPPGAYRRERKNVQDSRRTPA